ncbi:DUF4350 domain-containing protein [Streptomyces sp. NBC_01351]|uniref:DUF4350 domain-containing protein n=1 Tax=Streptomyces sp. NBC_01351 TaxID=2903833 RepID=UPI002E358E54|nr:DUF4350 domain-containing protein [Streptomyces sp. NBC_01351]
MTPPTGPMPAHPPHNTPPTGSHAAEPTPPPSPQGAPPAGSDGDGGVPGRPRRASNATTARPTDPSPRSAPEETPRRAPGTGGTTPTPPGPGETSPASPLGSGPAKPGPSNPGPAGTGTRRTRQTRLALRALALLGVLAAGVAILAALNSGTRHGLLDPRSADPYGSRAVAELLKERGVTTRIVTTAREAADAAGPRTTLLVTDPDRLGAAQRRLVRSAMDLSGGGRTVLIAPGSRSLPGFSPGVESKGEAPATSNSDDLDPACTLPAAATAGRATLGDGMRYTTTLRGATACYPSGDHPTLLVLPAGANGADTVVLGSGTILLNESLADTGNASLALQLLGSRPDLVWYMPSLADSDPDSRAADEEQSLLDLAPAGWSWALLQLFVAAALAALWRARRLGPLVIEKLPVAIRASEATEGRARLYRKARARDRAATVLRAAARERLAALTGVPNGQAHEPTALAPAVSARLADGSRDVTALLFGPTPSDDAALVALADHLDALEREVRTS